MVKPSWYCSSKAGFYRTILPCSYAPNLLKENSLDELYNSKCRIDLDANQHILWNSEFERWESESYLPGWVFSRKWEIQDTKAEDVTCLANIFLKTDGFGWRLKLSTGDESMNEHMEPICDLILNYLEENVNE